MSKNLKRILSAFTVCTLLFAFTFLAIAVEDSEPIDPAVTDDSDTEPDAPVVESIKFSVSAYSLDKGDTVDTELIVLPEDIEEYEIEYSSSNKNVATVNKDGKITAVGKGEAVITAKCGELTCTLTVTVADLKISIEQDHTLEKYVSGFSVGMTVDAVKSAFAKYMETDASGIRILSGSSEPSGNALIATGMVIDDAGVHYNVVVAGDVDGSGTITYEDTRTVISVLSGGAFNNPACERAAKFNGNNELSIKTALDMSDYVSNRITLD